MLAMIRAFPFLVLMNSAFAEKLREPRIELPVPKLDPPLYQEKALKRFDGGFPPPTNNFSYFPVRSLLQIRYWDDGQNTVGWDSIIASFQLNWFSTDGSLKKISPQLERTDGARVIRNASGEAIQWQLALFVIDIKKSDKGWVLTQWRAEDTSQVSHSPLRVPIAGRKCFCLFELEEQAFDPARLYRKVVVRQTYGDGQVITWYTTTTDSAAESKTTLESFKGNGKSPEVLVGRVIRSSTRIPDSRKFIETIRQEKFGPGGDPLSFTKRAAVWELDRNGVRSFVKEVPSTEEPESEEF